MSDNGELEGTPLRPEGSPPDFRIAVNGSEVVVSEAVWLQHVLRMPKATRRALYQAAYGIFTCPDALKKHAATLGKHVGDKPGPKGGTEAGERFLALKAEVPRRTWPQVADIVNEENGAENAKIEALNRGRLRSKQLPLLKDDYDGDQVRGIANYARRKRTGK